MPAQYSGNSVTKVARAAGGGGYQSDIPVSVPSAPAFTISKTSTSITANVTDAAGATSYECSVNGTNWTQGRTISGLNPGQAYTFELAGKNSAGTGPSTSESVTTNAATGDPSINSVTDNGDGTLTISGSNFGVKDQPTEILYDGGDFVRENGVENTYRAGLADGASVFNSDVVADEIWKGGTNEIILKKTGLRGTGTTAKFTAKPGFVPDNALWCGFPKAEVPGADIAYHTKYHTRWYVKWKYSFSRLKTLRNWVVTSGTFIYPDLVVDPEALGEELVMGDTGIVGYLIRYDGEKTSVYTPNSTAQFEVPDGTVITGVTSGATATISSSTVGTDNYGVEKVFRAWSRQDGSGSRFTVEQYKMSLSGGSADFGTAAWLTNKDVTVDFQDVWTALDTVVDFGKDSAKFFVNGRLVADMGGMSQDMTFGLVTAAIGWQSVRSIYNSIEFADIYVDHELRCVYLGNAQVWGDCTATEVQPISWNGDTEIVIPEIRTGAIDMQAPVYVFVTTKGVPEQADTGTFTDIGGAV